MADPFYLKAGSTLPVLTNRFSSGGVPIVLTGSGMVKMKHQFGDTFEKAYTLVTPQEGDDIGKIRVQFSEADRAELQKSTTEPDHWYTEYHHDFDNGDKAIFPTDGDVLYDKVIVLPSFA